MYQFISSACLLAIPYFIYPLKTHSPGLVLGLFLCLASISQIGLLPPLVTLAVSILLFLFGFAKGKSSLQQGRNPAMPMLLVFTISMSLLWGLADSFSVYADYLRLDKDFLKSTEILSSVLALSGPVLMGIRCDKKGSFSTAIFTVLLAEISVSLVASSQTNKLYYLMGYCLMRFCAFAYPVLLAVLLLIFLGKGSFRKTYLPFATLSLFTASISRQFYRQVLQNTENPGTFLYLLLALSMIAALFLFIAWNKRLTLVKSEGIVE